MSSSAYTIMILHDPDNSQQLWSDALRQSGFKVISVYKSELEDANASVYTNSPHIILLDEQYANNANTQIYKKIGREFPRIPVIGVVSRNADLDIEKLFQAGADDFIYEDSFIPELVARIRANLIFYRNHFGSRLHKKALEKNSYDQLRSEFWKFAYLSESEHVLIDHLLNRLGEALNLGRISFLKYQNELSQWSCEGQWTNNQHIKECKGGDLPEWLTKQLSNKIYLEVSDKLLQYLKNDHPQYYNNIKSQLIITYGSIENPSGFFLLETCEERRKWTPEEIKIARDLANIVKLKTEAIESTEISRRSEEKFRIITETSRELICMHDREGNFTYVSPSSKIMLGYTPEELIEFHPKNLIHPDDKQKVLDQYDQSTGNRSLNNKVEYRIKRKDGKYIWFDTITQPITTERGDFIELQTSSRDITDRKLAEQQISEKEEKYRNIFESMFDVYVELDVNSGEILEISPSVKRISGYSREELLGQSIFPFYANPGEGHQLIDKLNEDGRISDFEVTLLNKSGEQVTCSYSVRMIRNLQGQPSKIVGTLRDISERKSAEYQLEDAKIKAESASKAKSEFLANMSHEIRTPMNAILGFSEVLMNKIQDSEHKSHLEAILSSGRTLLSLINDILDLSKIEAGKMQINYEPLELPVLIEDIEHIFEKKLKEKDLDLKIDIDRNLPSVLLLDEVRIRQILFNLVGNAIKFTDKGYIKVKIYAEETAENQYELTIIVEDTGVGIPRKQQRLIFNAFQQQEGQDSRRYEGSGLGLSITKKLVEKMNGKINLDSRIGQGSRFEIILPGIERGELREAFLQHETADQTDVEFNPANILIVDDIQYNIDTIKQFIDSKNITFAEAQNAEKAIEIIKIPPPDLILMDLKLPNMSGYEATAFIKTHKKYQHIPVLAFTASAMASDETEAKTLFDDFLIKPVNKNELYGKLKIYLSSKPREAHHQMGLDHTCSEDHLKPHDYESLINMLESDLMNDWEEIKDNLVIYKIEDFLYKLKNLNHQFKIKSLAQYNQDLATYLNNFDIENIESKLKEFPHRVEAIKNG